MAIKYKWRIQIQAGLAPKPMLFLLQTMCSVLREAEKQNLLGPRVEGGGIFQQEKIMSD